MTEAGANPVTTHYEALLASRYTWMMGGREACLANARALLDGVGLTDQGSGTALDLGAGGGYHARLLANRGFDVVAVDTSEILLRELRDACAGLPVTAIQADLLDESKYADRGPFTLMLCVGDTLTHLPDKRAVERLVRSAARLLQPGGALILQFREQPRELSPQESIITVRSERDRIMQAVLHFEPQRVWVTDVVHEWNGVSWLTVKSTYPKLRLDPADVVDMALTAGLNVRVDEVMTRQRVLVFTRSTSA